MGLIFFKPTRLLEQPVRHEKRGGEQEIPLGCALAKGWYELTYQLSLETSHILASLELLTTEGGVQAELPLSERPTPGRRNLFYLAHPIQSARLTSSGAAGELILQRLEVTRYPALGLAYYFTYRFLKACVVQRGKPLRQFPIQKRVQYIKDLLTSSAHSRSITVGATAHSQSSYEDFMRQQESHLTAAHYQQRPHNNPSFSFVMPVYNTKPCLLRAAIDSIRAQYYENWELCIADDASPTGEIREILESYQTLDPRVRVTFRQTNGHISHCSNTALELVSHPYTVLIDHDDLLPPYALSEMALELKAFPDTEFLYSDQDLIDEEGQRSSPMFKPQYSPDLLYAQNYLNHLTLLKTARLREIGGWRAGYEGAQDYDLYLRYLDGVDPEQVRHLPKVLYHWRITQGSTAAGIQEKSYAVEAGRRALEEYFRQKDSAYQVSTLERLPYYRVKHPLPQQKPLVSLIIPTKDKVDLLRPCVQSIFERTDYEAFEVIVVDNGSQEQETLAFFEELAQQPKVRVISYPGEFNYSKINNYAVSCAQGSVLAFINNDIEIRNKGWLTEMVSHAIRPEIGCVGAKLLYEDETIQHAGVVLGLGGYAAHSHRGMKTSDSGYYGRLQITSNYSAVTAALLVIRKDTFLAVGGFEEEQLKVAYNDVDLCLKVWSAGYRNLYTPFAEAYHYESKSRGEDALSEDKMQRLAQEKRYLLNTWRELIENDPHYSPHLTRAREDFTLP